MCGLFGFFGKGKPTATLADAFSRAKKRGPDGSAWWDGCELYDRAAGRMIPPPTGLVLGHCRLATSGSVATVQPLMSGPYAITHNGNIRNHREIAKALSLQLTSTIDSELILQCLQREDSLAALLLAVPLEPGAVVAVTPQQLHFYAKGLPLYLLERPEGIYWCSTKGAEPDWRPVDRLSIRRDV
jgi:glutamine phosphoribosylpyrophosphate amidotransferase